MTKLKQTSGIANRIHNAAISQHIETLQKDGILNLNRPSAEAIAKEIQDKGINVEARDAYTVVLAAKSGVQIAKTIIREMDWSLDPWAVAMELFFNVSAHLYECGDMEADVNPDWGYKPGAMGNTIDTDYPAYTELSEMTNVQLLDAGNYLHRLTGMLQTFELAY